MSKSDQPKKRLMRVIKRIGLIIPAFLPTLVYLVFVYLSFANGEPYDYLNHDFVLNDVGKHYLFTHVVGGLLGILCGITLEIFYVLRFKKIRRSGGVLDRTILLFAMAILTLQLTYIIYYMIFQISEPVYAYERVAERLSWSISPIIDRVLRCIWAALAVSGLYLIVEYASSSKQRLAGWLEVFKQILIVSIPILICVFTHIMATLKGLPYNQSCCAIRLPDPDERTVIWFLVWEISGAVLAFVSSFILLVYRLKSYAKSKGSATAIVDLLCINILIGETIALFCYVLIVCNPGMARDRYRAGYFYELLGFDELPFYYSRWNECLFYTVFFLPAATIISSARAAMLIHKKNCHHIN